MLRTPTTLVETFKENRYTLSRRPHRRSVITKARQALEGTGLFTEDLTPEKFKTKSHLRHDMNEAYRGGKRPRFRDGERYTKGEL